MSNGYQVTLSINLLDRLTSAQLAPQYEVECNVQPPGYCDDKDPAVLAIHLETCGVLKHLYHLRKNIKANLTSAHFLKDKDWTVRGTLLAYKK